MGDSTIRWPQFSIPTTGSFVSTDAWKATSLHIINHPGNCSVCGTTCQEVLQDAATSDDLPLYILNSCTYFIYITVGRSYYAHSIPKKIEFTMLFILLPLFLFALNNHQPFESVFGPPRPKVNKKTSDLSICSCIPLLF